MQQKLIFSKRAIFILLLGFMPGICSAQQFFRLSADVSIKTKLSTGEQSLTLGKVYYDRNVKRIVYDVTFPEKEILVTGDTITYRLINNQITQEIFSPVLTEFSIFHLSLSAHLPDFGLKKTEYAISDVTKEGEMVITTWIPPSSMKDKLGNILVSTLDQKLFGVIFLDPIGRVNKKQFFENYEQVKGMLFPGKIVEISYTDGDENYQVMEFKNIKVDELENTDFYNFKLPAHK